VSPRAPSRVLAGDRRRILVVKKRRAHGQSTAMTHAHEASPITGRTALQNGRPNRSVFLCALVIFGARPFWEGREAILPRYQLKRASAGPTSAPVDGQPRSPRTPPCGRRCTVGRTPKSNMRGAPPRGGGIHPVMRRARRRLRESAKRFLGSSSTCHCSGMGAFAKSNAPYSIHRRSQSICK
jgi:hypothetical protein